MKKNSIKRLASVMLASAVLVSSVVIAPTNAEAATKKPTKLTLNATKKTMYVGQSYKVKVKAVKPTKASKSVTFKTSKKSVATVSSTGVVKAKKVGTAKITVTSKLNKKAKATVTITVKKAPKKMTVKKAKTLVAGAKVSSLKSYTLKPKFSPSKAYNEVTFKSSNKKVVKVSSKGKITAVKAGTAKIYVTSKYNKKIKATCKVKVLAAPTKITVPSKKTLYANGATANKTYTVPVKYKSAKSKYTYKTVKFTTSNSKVAKVNSKGKITAVGAGTATISVVSKANSKVKDTIKITVRETPSKISLGANQKLTVGQNITLTPVFTFKTTNAAYKYVGVNYTTSNAKVATVSASGVVTAVAPGTATITVSAKPNSAVKASITVTVEAKEEVVVTPVDFVVSDDYKTTINFDKNAKDHTIKYTNKNTVLTSTVTKADVAEFAGIIKDYLVFSTEEADMAASFNNGKFDAAITDIMNSKFTSSLRGGIGFLKVSKTENGKNFMIFNKDEVLRYGFIVSMDKVADNEYSATIKSTKSNKKTTITGITKTKNADGTVTVTANLKNSVNDMKLVSTIKTDGTLAEVSRVIDGKANPVIKYAETDSVYSVEINNTYYSELCDMFDIPYALSSLSGSNNY